MPLLALDSRPGPLLALGAILVAGILGGLLARRCRLPGVTGQILAGIGLGALVRGTGTDVDIIHDLRPVTHFALGLIAVTVGAHLDLRRLRNAGKRLAWLALIEATVTPIIVLTALHFIGGQPWTASLLLATLAISTAPATIVAVVHETRSRGVFMKTLIAAVALNNITCICLFEVARAATEPYLASGASADVWRLILAPLTQLGASAALGGGLGALLLLATRDVVRPEQLAAATLLTMLLTSGLADAMGFSPLLSCMFLGITLANFTPRKDEVMESAFSSLQALVLAAFFTLAGFHLDFDHLGTAGLLALLMVAARLVGKVTAGALAMRVAGAVRNVRRYLGLALVPQAGVAVGLILVIRENPAFDSISDLVLTVGLTSVTINEIIGPVLTRYSLQKSGDAGMHRPRLIDFLHEENIVTDFEAADMEEAVRGLVDTLAATHHVKLDKEALVEGALLRHAETSTCLGEGLAIPHVVVESGDRIMGAMGISSDGLRLPTPDGHPVHCMVLLVTPGTQRGRHLEVLAALAKAIAGRGNIRRQLYHADTPAHAYQLLHAEEALDFNYFLDDEESG